MKIQYSAFIILLIIYTLSCSPTLYLPVENDVLVQQNLMDGRKLYIEKCSGCHNLFLPPQFTEEQWLKNLDEMQFRSTITDQQKESIYYYLSKKAKIK